VEYPVSELSYRNETLDGLVGRLVLLGVATAPQLEPEEAEEIGEDPTTSKVGIMQSARTLQRLLAYDAIGITIRLPVDEEEPSVFVPWGAVLRLEAAADGGWD
jgi:hypothetical protein